MVQMRNGGALRAALLALGMLVLFAAQAGTSPALAGDNTGNTMVKLFGSFVLPDSDLKKNGSGVIDVTDETVPTVSIAYFLTNNLALEAICCFTEHSIYNQVPGLLGLGAGSKIASTWILPATLSLQYHRQMGAFKPYVGVGVSYFSFFSETDFTPAGSVDLKDDWGLALGGGVDVALGGGWQLSVDAKKILDMDTKIYVGGKYLDTAELDPWIVSVGVGYRFNFQDLLGH